MLAAWMSSWPKKLWVVFFKWAIEKIGLQALCWWMIPERREGLRMNAEDVYLINVLPHIQMCYSEAYIQGAVICFSCLPSIFFGSSQSTVVRSRLWRITQAQSLGSILCAGLNRPNVLMKFKGTLQYCWEDSTRVFLKVAQCAWFWEKMKKESSSSSFRFKSNPGSLSRAVSWINFSTLSKQTKRLFRSDGELTSICGQQVEEDENWTYRPQHRNGNICCCC